MFTLNQEYFRNDLLAFVGSRQNQSGIIWGSRLPNCVIITSGGKHGKTAGYSDKKNRDGTWSYIGQGGEGDQSPGNFANLMLINGNRDILLFTTREPNAQEFKLRGTRNKLYNFEGIFKLSSWDYYIPHLGKRAGDRLIRFELLPAKNIYNIDIGDPIITPVTGNEIQLSISLQDLRSKLTETESNGKKIEVTMSLVEYRRRSHLVRIYALKRANGICEHCDNRAPFICGDGSPYLEVHHINSLADDGPDSIKNVAAVCPNCHRELHFGNATIALNNTLAQKILAKEEK